jgi:RNA exonuclease NGL2
MRKTYAFTNIDFNFAPDDASYSLLVGDPLLPDQEESLSASRVVHLSVDPSIPTYGGSLDEQNDETAGDPDKVVTNARSPTLADGLFTVPELVNFFSRLPRLRSVYDEGLGLLDNDGGLPTFGSRVKLFSSRKGRNEPEYTSYTHYWKTVLGEPWPSSLSVGLRLILHLKITFSYWLQSSLV